MKLTNVQRKMLKVLSDGLPHHLDELRVCLADELGRDVNIQQHICAIRKQLLPRGRGIICEFYKRSYKHYRLVCLITSKQKSIG